MTVSDLEIAIASPSFASLLLLLSMSLIGDFSNFSLKNFVACISHQSCLDFSFRCDLNAVLSVLGDFYLTCFISGVLDAPQERLTWEVLLGTLSQENHQVLHHFVQQDFETVEHKERSNYHYYQNGHRCLITRSGSGSQLRVGGVSGQFGLTA